MKLCIPFTKTMEKQILATIWVCMIVVLQGLTISHASGNPADSTSKSIPSTYPVSGVYPDQIDDIPFDKKLPRSEIRRIQFGLQKAENNFQTGSLLAFQGLGLISMSYTFRDPIIFTFGNILTTSGVLFAGIQSEIIQKYLIRMNAKTGQPSASAWGLFLVGTCSQIAATKIPISSRRDRFLSYTVAATGAALNLTSLYMFAQAKNKAYTQFENFAVSPILGATEGKAIGGIQLAYRF